METLYEIKGTTLIIYTPKDLDHHSAELITEHSDWFVTRNNIKNMIFDFKNTEFMDSSGIGVLMGSYRIVRKLGGRINVRNVSHNINRVFTISGMYKIIDGGENNI